MTISLRRIKNIHFIGIGGVGMAGIAEVLLNQGYAVSGSDIASSALTQRLTEMGAHITTEHCAENVLHKDVVVVSSAIQKDNIELLTAHQEHIPVVPRALMLAELMRFHYGIAIAGSHGKTTTTSLISHIFAEGGLDPTYVIGGKLNSSGRNARLGTGKYFIAEADESDASFLHLHPMLAIVTNIDNDHLGTYQNDFEILKQTFIHFLQQLPFYGLAVLCMDCPIIRSLLPQVGRPYLTYGFHPEADVQARACRQEGTTMTFTVAFKEDKTTHDFKLNLPGKHNVLNALAAMAVAREEGVPLSVIRHSFETFSGIGRRFQIHGQIHLNQKKATLVEDYGHHPNEIRATIQAARDAWPNKRLVMVFQPHRYSRTVQLFDDFSQVLSEVDVLCLLDVYGAGEEPLKEANVEALSAAVQQFKKGKSIFVPETIRLNTVLEDLVESEDIILMQGAGNIGSLAVQLAQNK